MSVESLSVVLNHSRARGVARLVALGIANHDGDGGAWPSIATLAKYAGGVDERTVRRAINELVSLGEVAVELNGGGDRATRSDRRPNLYHVTITCPPECDGSKAHRPRGDIYAPPLNSRGDTGVRHGGAPTPPEPSFEPSTNSPRGERSPRATLATPPTISAAKTAPLARADRCPDHQADDIAPRCGGCRDARALAEQAAADAKAADRAARLAADRAARAARADELATAIAGCDMCNDEGRLASGHLCHHDPDAAARAADGISLARTMLRDALQKGSA